LQLFRSESRKTHTQYGQSKSLQLSNIHKFTLSNSDAGEIREHFQRTDENTLRKAVRKLKKRNRNPAALPAVVGVGRPVPDFQGLMRMRFFKKLLEKENQNCLNEMEESVIIESREFRHPGNPLEESRHYENEWESENDIGYETYECSAKELPLFSQQIALRKNLQENAIKHSAFPEEYFERHNDKISKITENVKDKKQSRLPAKTVFKKEEQEEIYPIEHEGTTYDSYDLKIIYDR
jgi:hypothetical protein